MPETPAPDARPLPPDIELPTRDVPPPPSVTRQPAGRGPWSLILVILVLLLLGALAYAGWHLWQERAALQTTLKMQSESLAQLGARAAALEAQNNELATRQGDLSRLVDRNGTEIAALQSRIEDSLGLMGRISEELSGGRTRFQLVAIEHLLLLASDRLLLERDAPAALAALDLVDQRLAALSDPRLFPVREAVAQERTALRAVPVADLTSATLSLSSLIERVPQLPLIAHAPKHYEAPEARTPKGLGAADSGWRRVWSTVQATMQSLFTIRREDNSRSRRLLPPEAEAVVYQVLSLKLEGARVALLRRETVALREELRSADAWLDSQFKPDDPGVLATRAELTRLQALELAPPLPESGRSLAALRALLQPASP